MAVQGTTKPTTKRVDEIVRGYDGWNTIIADDGSSILTSRQDFRRDEFISGPWVNAEEE